MEVSIRNRLRKQDLVLPDEEVPDSQNSNINSVEYSEVKELVLDGVKLRELSQEDSEFLGRFSNLQHLSLNATGLQKLDNFPQLENLRVLELQDNHISGGLDVLLNYKNLRCLLLGGNKIRDFTELCLLKELPNLETLSILLNPIAENNPDSYRSIVFETIPNLVVLDEMDKDGKEVEDYGYDEDEVEVLDDDTIGGEEIETGHSDAQEISDDNDDEEDEDDDGVDLKEFYENDFDEEDDEDEVDFEPGDADLDDELDDFEGECDDDEEDDEEDETETNLKKQKIEVSDEDDS
ncbi:U2 snrnp-specific A [Cryptosporidium xiaoi]|uniref:U2 snrnp-specific A n=1 Tax=Cryptosporidium xiaoi TaxID=659607 RepID=A0AAV9Y1G5_9CRYT